MIDLKKQVLYMSDEDIWELRDWILEAVRLMEMVRYHGVAPYFLKDLEDHIAKIKGAE